jgi:Diadenosine tetraphosphate (Ap4A) hydrolase and other HIT family hydrolases
MDNYCPFCMVESEREIIASSPLSVAFFDGFPVSPGHALIIPKRHVSSFFDLSQEERQDLLNLADSVKQIVEERYHPDGYNIGVNVGEAAGQSIFHVHMHLIPRYQGDVPNPRGGVRGVIPDKQNY